MSHPKYAPHNLNGALGRVIEECGEVVCAGGKIVRFGFLSVNPEVPECDRETNIRWLLREMQDVREAFVTLEQFIKREFGE